MERMGPERFSKRLYESVFCMMDRLCSSDLRSWSPLRPEGRLRIQCVENTCAQFGVFCFVSFFVFYSFGRVLLGLDLPLGCQRGRLHEVWGRTGLRGADEPSFGDESEVRERSQANLSSAGS